MQYGPNIRALGVHLTQGQLLPFARATQLIHDLYGIAISPGTLVNWVAQASTILRSSADLIARHLHQASLLHADESRLCGVVFKHDKVAAFATLFESILREGQQLNPPAKSPTGKRGRIKQSFAFNLLHRLQLHATAVLRFIHDPNAPFTNNLGERAVRMPKVKQKISGCFRTHEGADNFSIIRSCLATLYKQGHGMLEVLRSAFLGEPILPASSC
ncbi:MAG: hypothetical protein RL748_2165 [Pseudomonadota bacterium]